MKAVVLYMSIFTVALTARALEFGMQFPYNRTNDLRRIEESLARFDNQPGVIRGGREAARYHEWLRMHTNSDHHYLIAQRDVESLLNVTEELHLKWQTLAPSSYYAVLGRALYELQKRFPKEPSSEPKVAQIGAEILTRLPALPLREANWAVHGLLRVPGQLPEPLLRSALDLLPRAEALNGVLAVQARVDDFVRSFLPAVELEKLPASVRRVAEADPAQYFDLASSLHPDNFDLLQDFMANRDLHRTLTQRTAGSPESGESEYQRTMVTALAGYIQRNYSQSPADLKELHRALDLHIKDPVFKERLVMAAFKGTNPLATLLPVAKDAATTPSNATVPARKPAAHMATASPTAKQSRTPFVTEPQAAACDPVPLATASFLDFRRSVLWLTSGGAAALILFVLWRAQARGNPGRDK